MLDMVYLKRRVDGSFINRRCNLLLVALPLLNNALLTSPEATLSTLLSFQGNRSPSAVPCFRVCQIASATRDNRGLVLENHPPLLPVSLVNESRAKRKIRYSTGFLTPFIFFFSCNRIVYKDWSVFEKNWNGIKIYRK